MDMNEEYGLTPYETREILFYKTDNGEVRVEILLYQENLWLTQAKMAELFEVQKAAISKHLKNIFTSGELQEEAVVSKIIHEYAPLKIKMAITGNGSASKEQVAAMLQRLLSLRDDQKPHFMDATDALAAAYCHFLQMGRPETGAKHYSSWKDFALKNQRRVSGNE